MGKSRTLCSTAIVPAPKLCTPHRRTAGINCNNGNCTALHVHVRDGCTAKPSRTATSDTDIGRRRNIFRRAGLPAPVVRDHWADTKKLTLRDFEILRASRPRTARSYSANERITPQTTHDAPTNCDHHYRRARAESDIRRLKRHVGVKRQKLQAAEKKACTQLDPLSFSQEASILSGWNKTRRRSQTLQSS